MKIDSPMTLELNQSLSHIQWSEKPDSIHNESSFTDLLKDTVVNTNENLLAADDALQDLASGQSTSLHQTMLCLEEAKLSFQFLEQVRNRLMSAYQDLLREQI